MKPKAPPWWQQVKVLKDWWWLIGLLVGAIILWGNLPKRVDKLEAGQAEQAEDIVDLKGIAKSLEGYTKAMSEMQQRQQPANSPASRASRAPQSPREITWEGKDLDGTCWRCLAPTEAACWEDNPATKAVDNLWELCPDE